MIEKVVDADATASDEQVKPSTGTTQPSETKEVVEDKQSATQYIINLLFWKKFNICHFALTIAASNAEISFGSIIKFPSL